MWLEWTLLSFNSPSSRCVSLMERYSAIHTAMNVVLVLSLIMDATFSRFSLYCVSFFSIFCFILAEFFCCFGSPMKLWNMSTYFQIPLLIFCMASIPSWSTAGSARSLRVWPVGAVSKITALYVPDSTYVSTSARAVASSMPGREPSHCCRLPISLNMSKSAPCMIFSQDFSSFFSIFSGFTSITLRPGMPLTSLGSGPNFCLKASLREWAGSVDISSTCPGRSGPYFVSSAFHISSSCPWYFSKILSTSSTFCGAFRW
mmetsp:Transcript_2037/g.7295  ORF Transcript_2037/g.7295 Transcript_2037/m.7295 type:complete len:259 (-) Transcript_2037:111-887(-)